MKPPQLIQTITTLVACLAVGCGNTPSMVNNQPSPASRVAVIVAPSNATVQVGGAMQFTATVTPSGANQAVTWSVSGTGCSGASCGAVDATGKYTAPATVPNPPTVTITASLVADSTADTATVTVVVSPSMSVNLTSLDFGNETINTSSAPKKVTLTNTGTAVQPVSARMNGVNFADFTETNDCPPMISAGASCSFSVTFRPSSIGGRVGILVIDGTLDEEALVSLGGTGTQ